MPAMQITTNGDHLLDIRNLVPQHFDIGASLVGPGSGATVQLWGRIAGTKYNLDPAQSVAVGSPVVWPNSYTKNAERGVTVSGLAAGDRLTVEWA